MHDWSDITNLPDDFDQRVRMFPLPELVVFPHAMQPLHIFEPRYCDMLRDALASDHLIAMATVKSGQSIDLKSAKPPVVGPAVEDTLCIGRIVSHTELEGDRHNILLVGMKRATMIDEIDNGRTFRTASVDVMDDYYPPANVALRNELKDDLLRAFASIIPQSANVQKNLHDLMAGQMTLGPITDIISYTMPFEVDEKIQLLAEPDVDKRAALLIQYLRSGKIQLHSVSIEEQQEQKSQSVGSMIRANRSDQFPPPFSMN
ncbi:LON peptidase substrate-binding domain-containing protein [Crateriforma conspicua]|uniref:Lon protease 2 n=1 Tax=Crateriforma conspicua TaxID=2527996 RepID=A0A5C5Y552_9PLAN|nr:LON peptidase substrate-binding domain-containing protein [Crateriforma conspicua]TWT69833.1 Lon protease 2 [Crateriforma conspicua]